MRFYSDVSAGTASAAISIISGAFAAVSTERGDRRRRLRARHGTRQRVIKSVLRLRRRAYFHRMAFVPDPRGLDGSASICPRARPSRDPMASWPCRRVVAASPGVPRRQDNFSWGSSSSSTSRARRADRAARGARGGPRGHGDRSGIPPRRRSVRHPLFSRCVRLRHAVDARGVLLEELSFRRYTTLRDRLLLRILGAHRVSSAHGRLARARARQLPARREALGQRGRRGFCALLSHQRGGVSAQIETRTRGNARLLCHPGEPGEPKTPCDESLSAQVRRVAGWDVLRAGRARCSRLRCPKVFAPTCSVQCCRVLAVRRRSVSRERGERGRRRSGGG